MISYCDERACSAAECVPVLCTGRGVPSNETLFERSKAAIPGGVNSSIRAFKAVGGSPYLVARGDGPYVFDVEGRRLIDLVQSYGAIILGHAHPTVTAAIRSAAGDGTSFGAPTPREMKLAETIRERVPSCELVRLMNSGTEATSTAVRLARGHTGRDRIVTFHGNFHGATDALLAAGGSGVATLGLPGTAGVPAGAVAETLVVPYNQVPTLDDDVAAVIVEPVAANMGVVAPQPLFLAGLRSECDRVGALLIFDEVITGFRIDTGGAQAKYDVSPDLTTFGKVIGGGLPIGAVGGRRDVMTTLSPLGPVFHAGTLSGNPLATAAGLAALGELTPDVYMELSARARRLAALLRDACAAAGFAAQFPVVGTLLGIVCGDGPAPVDFDGARRTNETAYAAFFQAMLREGVAMAPGAYEAIFVGVGHTDDVIDQIGDAAGRAATAAAARIVP
ncbi:MAG: glutamate-1-semialdehyde 2,1-aminomutase [Actinomycetota bacterium]|nr:glutamate-1-semialdehyde 2,1-aminomutase [Actinomycetota bacterium]